MASIRTREDLTELAHEGVRRLTSALPRLSVGMSSCGLAAGAGELFDVLQSEVGSKARLVRTGCMGFCGAEPLVDVSLPGKGRVLYGPVHEALAVELAAEAQAGRFATEKVLGSLDPLVGEFRMVDNVSPLVEHPFYSRQVKRVSRNLGQIDPLSLEEYAARGGYTALIRVLEQMSPEQVIEEIKQSGLRGRGGAGFPTGLKWEIARKAGSAPRYVIMNGDEGDPGAYMDRSLMEGDPHAIIEGMLIGAYAVGAGTGVLYVRAEYPLAVRRLNTAMGQAREAGLLGNNILGADFYFHLHLVSGAGAFVSGEETALINALENHIAEPDPRPPYPAECGLDDRPTCINNVETWANVPLIIHEGPETFSRYGSPSSKGTKLFCLVGDVARTGPGGSPIGYFLIHHCQRHRRRSARRLAGKGRADGRTFRGLYSGYPVRPPGPTTNSFRTWVRSWALVASWSCPRRRAWSMWPDISWTLPDTSPAVSAHPAAREPSIWAICSTE